MKTKIEKIFDENGVLMHHMTSLESDLVDRISYLEEALKEITKGDGAYDTDPLKHASNCIENMKDIAQKSLATN